MKQNHKPAKRLALSRETIRELQRDELHQVAGGQVSLVPCVIPTHQCTGYYPSINAPCTTTA